MSFKDRWRELSNCAFRPALPARQAANVTWGFTKARATQGTQRALPWISVFTQGVRSGANGHNQGRLPLGM